MSAETQTMTHWFVTSPSYPYHEVVLEDGSGPTYDISDFTEVDAPTRREAMGTCALAHPLPRPWSNPGDAQ